MNKFAGNQIMRPRNTGSGKAPRVGELLVAAGIITNEMLNESLQIAKSSRSMIGRTLVTLGRLDEHKLQTTLDVQNLIRKGTINTHIGIKALGIACHSRSTIDEALNRLGWEPSSQNETEVHQNELAKLFIDTGWVNKETLEIAQNQSHQNNLPLGRCLVVNRYITQHKLEAVLCAQSLIKDKHITTQQALAALKTSSTKRQTFEQSLIEFGVRPLSESDRCVGNILTLAGVITEVGKLTALEKSLTEDRSIGDVLIDLEMITPDILDKTMTLQTQILAGHISLRQAGEVLSQSLTTEQNLQTLLANILSKGQSVNQVEQILELLVESGLLTREVIDTAKSAVQQSGRYLGKEILAQQEISQAHLDAAWQAQRMIDDRMISFDYACNALRKMTGQDSSKPSQKLLQQSYDEDAAIEIPEERSWFMRLKDTLFTRKLR